MSVYALPEPRSALAPEYDEPIDESTPKTPHPHQDPQLPAASEKMRPTGVAGSANSPVGDASQDDDFGAARADAAGRAIFFALDDCTNLLSAIKCTFEHLAEYPNDQFTLLAVVASESERELTISRATTLLRAIHHTLATPRTSLELKVVVAPTRQAPALVCAMARAARAHSLILGVSAGTGPPGAMLGHCVVHAHCRVVVKRLTHATLGDAGGGGGAWDSDEY